MGEISAASGDGPGGNHIFPTPHSLEELYGFFSAHEGDDPVTYQGYAELAAQVADAIDATRRRGKSSELGEEPLRIDLPLIPGRSDGIRPDEHTPASQQLLELIYAVNNLEPVADEITDEHPKGRILYQSATPGFGVNIIEEHIEDAQGEIIKLTAVSDVPEDLLAKKQIESEAKPFLTTEQEREAWDSLYDDLGEIPTLPIDEAEIVENYLRHHRAA